MLRFPGRCGNGGFGYNCNILIGIDFSSILSRCFISADEGTVYAFVGPFALILVVRYFSSSFVVRGSNIANYLFYSYAYFPGA